MDPSKWILDLPNAHKITKEVVLGRPALTKVRQDVEFVLSSQHQCTLSDRSQLTSQHDRVAITAEVSRNTDVQSGGLVQLMYALRTANIVVLSTPQSSQVISKSPRS